MKALVKTKLPGPKSAKKLNLLKKLNGAYSDVYPFVHSNQGQGCYFKDIDNNVFLDFACQVASNPLGYNYSALNKVIKSYNKSPVKIAGQDFAIPEHLDLLKELTSITPKNLNSAFLVNSGAEAVENTIKICMRQRKKAKFGISFKNAFHGRTLGALSLTNTKPIYNKNFFSIPVRKISFEEDAPEKLESLIRYEAHAEDIAFIIIEIIQGEGGYNIAPKKLIRNLRAVTKVYKVPLIIDEVQSGMGRTGKWWAFQHYNINPDVMGAAKALQVGAAIANRKLFPEPGSLSSTWGGGSRLDLALGTEIIKEIKRKKLLSNINKMGKYLKKRLNELAINTKIENVRGLGLMIAFDMPDKISKNNLIIGCLKNGLVLLGSGQKTIRLLPPYIVGKKEIDEAVNIIENSYKETVKYGFKHIGEICNYLGCSEDIS